MRFYVKPSTSSPLALRAGTRARHKLHRAGWPHERGQPCGFVHSPLRDLRNVASAAVPPSSDANSSDEQSPSLLPTASEADLSIFPQPTGFPISHPRLWKMWVSPPARSPKLSPYLDATKRGGLVHISIAHWLSNQPSGAVENVGKSAGSLTQTITAPRHLSLSLVRHFFAGNIVLTLDRFRRCVELRPRLSTQ